MAEQGPPVRYIQFHPWPPDRAGGPVFTATRSKIAHPVLPCLAHPGARPRRDRGQSKSLHKGPLDLKTGTVEISRVSFRGHRTGRRAARLRTIVPEALSPAWVGIEPAKPPLRRGPRPRGGRRRTDEAKRGAGRDRAAGRPAIGPRSDPDVAMNVNRPAHGTMDRAMDGSVNRPMMSRAVHGPMMTRAIHRPMMTRAVHGPMGAAWAMDRPMDAAAPRRDRRDQAVAHLKDRARPSDDLDRFSLRQTVAAKREAGDRASDRAGPIHGVRLQQGGPDRPPSLIAWRDIRQGRACGASTPPRQSGSRALCRR